MYRTLLRHAPLLGYLIVFLKPTFICSESRSGSGRLEAEPSSEQRLPGWQPAPPASSPGSPPQRRGHIHSSGRKCLEFRFRFREWTEIFFSSPSHQLDFPTKFCFHVPNSELWTFSSHKQHRVESNSTLVSTMASSPQKSPSSPKSPTPKSPSSRKKDDSFLGKLGGTLARRKKAKEGNKQTTAC